MHRNEDKMNMSKAISRIVVSFLKPAKDKPPRRTVPTTDDGYENPSDTITFTHYPEESRSFSNRRGKVPLPPTPTSDAVSQLPYFHPSLRSKEDVQNFMSQYSLQDGYFIIRRSFKNPNSYTITVNHQSGLKHIPVVMNGDKFSLKDKTFSTFDDLVQFYSHKQIPNKENVDGILLKFPIRRRLDEFGEYISVDEMTANKPTERKESITSRTSEHSSKDSSVQPPPLPLKIRDSKTSSLTTEEDEMCDCGLSIKKSTLPMGWSVHLSQDEESRGQPFFLSPKKETHWELPMTVCLCLDSEQQDFIRNMGKETVSKTWVCWNASTFSQT